MADGLFGGGFGSALSDAKNSMIRIDNMARDAIKGYAD